MSTTIRTVRELREFIKDLPDAMEIFSEHEESIVLEQLPYNEDTTETYIEFREDQ